MSKFVYCVTLKPIDSFYFGGEDSFGEVGKDASTRDKYFAKKSAYFAKGEKFPQQTQLLGMIRKEILLKSEYLLYHRHALVVPKGYQNKANAKVGNRKWIPLGALNLGKILNLSSVCLADENDIYTPAPMDKVLKEKDTIWTLEEGAGTSIINGRPSDAVYSYSHKEKYFGAKDEWSDEFISDNHTLNLDEIFKETFRTGNQTLGYGDTDSDDEQFYKIKSYTFKGDYRFAFELTLEEDIFNEEYSSIVELGGERSKFEMTICKNRKNIPSYSSYASSKYTRIVLISDAKVDSSIFTYCKTALANKVIFRSLNSIYVRDQNNTKIKQTKLKTQKTVLLSKGSVFYPKDKSSQDKIVTLLKKGCNYRTIGYNRYKIIDKKGN